MTKSKTKHPLHQYILDLHTEVDCRIEYAADSGGHLKYVRSRLQLILDKMDETNGEEPF